MLLHLLLTIVTGGLWLIVWICVSASSDFHCVKCGNRSGRRKTLLTAGIVGAALIGLITVLYVSMEEGSVAPPTVPEAPSEPAVRMLTAEEFQARQEQRSDTEFQAMMEQQR